MSAQGSSRMAWSRTGTRVAAGPRLGAGKQRHLVAELDQGVGEMGDDPFRAAVEAGRDGLVEWRDLGNLQRRPPRR